MHITEAIKIAFLSLWANKLRSALTLLGVVIGVAAVIAVVTFVNGINGYVGREDLQPGRGRVHHVQGFAGRPRTSTTTSKARSVKT